MCERVEQLGGQFELASAPGQGATVSVTLPL
jgi:signal transduction histidine kinase